LPLRVWIAGLRRGRRRLTNGDLNRAAEVEFTSEDGVKIGKQVWKEIVAVLTKAVPDIVTE
jgi:hypothetical protein